jgi:hypothetical protein
MKKIFFLIALVFIVADAVSQTVPVAHEASVKKLTKQFLNKAEVKHALVGIHVMRLEDAKKSRAITRKNFLFRLPPLKLYMFFMLWKITVRITVGKLYCYTPVRWKTGF